MNKVNNKKTKGVEVEVRGLMSESKYREITIELANKSDRFEEDNKTSYFFVIRQGILKISDELSKNKAKISYKNGDESENILSEYEIPISRFDVKKTVELFKNLGFEHVNEVLQKRTNYLYKEAVISIKYTPDFGPHFEIEMMVVDNSEAKVKKKIILSLCEELGLEPLSKNEINSLNTRINKKHGFIS